ncbi:cytochrome P450 [Dendryphion nanum]|uniref:Cytochrome P450 n=1 Tax=Dendryphion nanum TaxID=256645 RepID=A0A9P9IJ75_9PLEO|nr:cytochrome P450 [Dendryphion nanum]
MFWGHLKLMGEVMAMFPGTVHPQYAVTTMCHMFDLPGAFYLDLWPLGPEFLVIVDPDIALHTTVIKNHPKHGDIPMHVDPIVGKDNIVSINGPKWKYLHNMLAPAFAVSRIRGMVGMIGDEVMQFRATLKKFAESGEIFHMEHTASCLTFDVIGTAVFGPGSSLGAQINGSSPSLQNFMDIMTYNAVQRDSKNPWTKFTARQKRLTATSELNATLSTLIRQRYNELERDNVDVSQKRKLTIMDLVLRDRLEETRKTGGGTEAGLNPEFMDVALTQIKTMLLAGTGTTNDTITFTYMLLSKHPEVVQKLREEHTRVFAPTIEETHEMLHNPDHHNKINDLTYTEHVVKETLRFFPIGSSGRSEDENGYFDFKGERYVTKGHFLLIVSHAMQLNPKLFPNAGTWDPDRFARNESPRHAWRPFERGPRACLGQTLAMDELKIILLLTVRDFDFHCSGLTPNKTPRVPWTDMDLTFGDRAFQEFVFEARPRDGMPMTVSKVGKP